MAKSAHNRKKLIFHSAGIIFLALGVVWMENAYGVALLVTGVSMLIGSRLMFRR